MVIPGVDVDGSHWPLAVLMFFFSLEKKLTFSPTLFMCGDYTKILYLGRVDCVIAKFYFNGKSRSDPSC